MSHARGVDCCLHTAKVSKDMQKLLSAYSWTSCGEIQVVTLGMRNFWWKVRRKACWASTWPRRHPPSMKQDETGQAGVSIRVGALINQYGFVPSLAHAIARSACRSLPRYDMISPWELHCLLTGRTQGDRHPSCCPDHGSDSVCGKPAVTHG